MTCVFQVDVAAHVLSDSYLVDLHLVNTILHEGKSISTQKQNHETLHSVGPSVFATNHQWQNIKETTLLLIHHSRY